MTLPPTPQAAVKGFKLTQAFAAWQTWASWVLCLHLTQHLSSRPWTYSPISSSWVRLASLAAARLLLLAVVALAGMSGRLQVRAQLIRSCHSLQLYSLPMLPEVRTSCLRYQVISSAAYFINTELTTRLSFKPLTVVDRADSWRSVLGPQRS